MSSKATTAQTNDKNDWRLMGQDEYLINEKLISLKYQKHSEIWDHEHCEFCSKKISEYEGDLHEGYCTINNQWWICEECFNDFKKVFNWILV